MTGESKYADLVERTFLNNMLSSLSAEGDRHYYTNPLMTGGRERWHWPGHDCACCPSNLARVISSIGGYAYSHNDDTIIVNQYLASEGTVPLPGNPVTLIQTTRYPWDGDIAVEVRPEAPDTFKIKLRIPLWARNHPMPGNLYKYVPKQCLETDARLALPESREMQPIPLVQPCRHYSSPLGDDKITLAVNGSPMEVNIEKGYVEIEREWKAGDTIRMNLPMPIRRVIAHPKAVADKGLVAIERGPIVYCAEFKDNAVDVSQLTLPDNARLSATFEQDFFGGTVTLTSDSGLKLIPYYLYANRGKGWMRVWLPREETR